MKKFFKLAWRNIWRNRRRSYITMSAIIFAVVLTGIMRSLQYGSYDALESYAVRLFAGDLQVHQKGYQDDQTIANSFVANTVDLAQIRAKYPQVQSYCKRLTGFGLLSSDSTSMGAMLIGVEPAREPRVTKLLSQIASGQTLDTLDSHRVLLGVTLAMNLRVDIGDTVVVLSQGFHNELAADRYIVKGTLRCGSEELDRVLTVMSLHDAQELLYMQDRITQIVLRTDNFRKAPDIAASLRAVVGADFEVLAWPQLMPEMLQLIAWDNVSGAIFAVFLLIIVGFEILNTTLMNIMERVKEFGILQALGVKPRQLSLMILLESVCKILFALVIGLLVTFVIVMLVKDYPLPLSDDMQKAMATWGFSTDFYFANQPRVYLEPLIAVSVISALSLFYPIWMATRLSPSDALRKT